MSVVYPPYTPTGSITINAAGAGAGSGPITVTGAGAGAGTGQVYVSNGTGASWASPNSASSKIKLDGKDSDILIQGKSMRTWMENVEKRLSILEPKPELLEKYEALQTAYDHYKTLESLLYDDQKPNK